MAKQDAFEKLHVEERDKADLSGVLEQLNLPPAVVEYVRKHQKTIYIVIGVLTAIVVTWALYDSYLEKRTAKSSSALTIAQKKGDDEKIAAFEKVIDDFSGTSAAQWAQIELARHYLSKEDYATTLQYYQAVKKDIDEGNPLFPLVVFGLAQTEETLGNTDSALAEYDMLKKIVGYESIGYMGASRVHEVKGDKESAIAELEEYLGTLIGDAPESPEKIYITEKISRIKAAAE